MKKMIFTLSLMVCLTTIAFAQLTPKFVSPGPPIAQGQLKFLGGVHSAPQKINFDKYWNQVTPENGGKWGAVEATRGVFTWGDLDSAFKYAKDRNYPFKMHNLIWGSQQPTWIETLPADTQLIEINKWYSAIAQRYPYFDFIDVVNEPLHATPSGTGHGNYIGALGGSGVTGWDWVITSFTLARKYFPKSKLLINEYNLMYDTAACWKYIGIINLLKTRGLIDGIGNQAHAPEFPNVPAATITRCLTILGSAGLPVYASELDIDGLGAIDQGGVHVVSPIGDSTQLAEYKRVFPLIWEHPSTKGVTLWGYLPGHWRSNQGAYIAYSDGTERPALVWLRKYVTAFYSVLPITLTRFDAVKNNPDIVKLSWAVTEDHNIDYYIVEKSVDQLNFKPLINVKTNNSTLLVTDYAAIDSIPYNGKNYYRIVMVNNNGVKSYSGIRMIDITGNKQSLVTVYPNPALTHFTIKTEAVTNRKRNILITDLSGKLVKSLSFNNSGIQTVYTNELVNGTYLIQITDNNNSKVIKLVVNK